MVENGWDCRCRHLLQRFPALFLSLLKIPAAKMMMRLLLLVKITAVGVSLHVFEQENSYILPDGNTVPVGNNPPTKE
ncbi:hypothetical protein Bca4012_102141 [Brassica carinata]|uniref:Uncharacterized protein n=1 Tax=Brassica oleracea var. oleracea TaxID=109376 RepID=A0A0D3D1B7_BRAOL